MSTRTSYIRCWGLNTSPSPTSTLKIPLCGPYEEKRHCCWLLGMVLQLMTGCRTKSGAAQLWVHCRVQVMDILTQSPANSPPLHLLPFQLKPHSQQHPWSIQSRGEQMSDFTPELFAGIESVPSAVAYAVHTTCRLC